MKKWFVLPILCILLMVCVKPENDNEFDPNNPNKVSVEGNVYGFDGSPLGDIKVALFYDESDTTEQFTDDEGWYGFDNVDPGIYTIWAQGGYYGPFECYPESLAAGSHETFDIQFNTAYWDFENEPLNTPEPRGFQAVVGSWRVTDDPEQCHAYTGVTPGTGLALAVTDIGAKDFFYESRFKVDTISGNTFFTGLIFRYQDDHNFYLVFCASNSMALIVSDAGVWTTIDSTAHSFALDTWYKMAVECCDDHLKVFLDSETVPVLEVHNNIHAGGQVGLFAEYHTTVSFDDIYIEKWE